MQNDTNVEVERTRAVLAAASVDGVDDDGLRDLLVSAEGLRNAAEALQAQVMVELRDRAHRADVADDAVRGTAYVPYGGREEFVADEVAVLLTCTRVAAGYRLATALAAADWGPVAEAWRPRRGGLGGSMPGKWRPLLISSPPDAQPRSPTSPVERSPTRRPIPVRSCGGG